MDAISSASTEMADKPEHKSEEAEARTEEAIREASSEDDDATHRSPNVSLRSVQSLERLRDRIETAAHELKRLREENQSLSARIKELEQRPNASMQNTFLSLEQDPELLRRKINGFIELIERYLEREGRSS